METNINEIEVNGVSYVKKGTANAVNSDGLPYVIIRTTGAGVHAGYLKAQQGEQVELVNSRRLWYWAGAKTLSELSQFGPQKPKDCKFTIEIPKITINGVHEIIPTSANAEKAIKDIKEWK